MGSTSRSGNNLFSLCSPGSHATALYDALRATERLPNENWRIVTIHLHRVSAHEARLLRDRYVMRTR